MQATNPATGEVIKEYDQIGMKEVNEKIEKAQRAWENWRGYHFGYRGEKLKKAADILRERKEQYALLITQEMGKTIKESRSEIEKCAWVCDFYAEKAGGFLLDERVRTEAQRSYVRYQPLGLVLAVMPWNFPFWQVFRFAAPALMAGNGGLLKHASNVPGCAQAIEDIFKEAGVNEGLFANLPIPSGMVEAVINHPSIKAVTLTGSGPAGKAVAEAAGRQIKKTVLELGGSDAYIILKDADLDKSAEICKNSRLLNAGQSCIGAKRFVVVKDVYDDFLKIFREKMEAATMGDPTDEYTNYGPMARFDLRDELHNQVLESINKGAECILGGEIPKNKGGAFYPATILTNVKPGMPAYEDELFGPVASVIKAENEDDAIRIANDSQFGLGAAVFTQDLERGENIAATKIQAGACFVNEMVKSDPRLPFGGIKQSGYGRELSHHGIKEFTNAKTIWVAKKNK
jgi:succinate-semialdehyde dehydrogenase/glutarate-semialdehyde dehydrogenase